MKKRYLILVGVPDAADDPLPVAPGARADRPEFGCTGGDRGRRRIGHVGGTLGCEVAA